jgi:hypothetical protein
MTEISFSGVTGMTVPFDVYCCDYYGNNCILIATINNSIPPTITIQLPPIFETYSSVLIRLSNCVNCDYEELIVCS